MLFVLGTWCFTQAYRSWSGKDKRLLPSPKRCTFTLISSGLLLEHFLLVRMDAVTEEATGGGLFTSSSYPTDWIMLPMVFSCLEDVGFHVQQAVAYTHDSSGRVLFESTSCVAVLLTRVATGLAALLAPGPDGTENVGGAATAEGQTMTQIITQAKVLNTADHLCSCLGATGNASLPQSFLVHVSALFDVFSLFDFCTPFG